VSLRAAHSSSASATFGASLARKYSRFAAKCTASACSAASFPRCVV
jgi:hypothetical protein